MPRMKPTQIRDMLADALNGRVSDPEVAALLASLGAQPGATYAEVFVRQLLIRACLGDSRAMAEVLDRIVGKTTINSHEKDSGATYRDFLMAVVEIEEKRKLGIPTEVDPMKLLDQKKEAKDQTKSASGSEEPSVGETGERALPRDARSQRPSPPRFEDLL